MKLILFRPTWGTLTRWEEFIPQAAADGYEGIETGALRLEPDHFRRLLRDHNLRLTSIVLVSGDTPEQQLDSLREGAERWIEMGSERIVAHSARDAWPLARSVEFYGRCVEWERTLSIPVAHETHRGRAFFNPWATREILRQVPDLRLCCDLSHWVCVAERLLADCEEEIALAAERCIHVHARVGHAQGPQVADPSAPEYAAELEAHERWWQMMWSAAEARGDSEFTITPEFGPPRYMPTLPHVDLPVADQGRVIDFMRQRLRRRFGASA